MAQNMKHVGRVSNTGLKCVVVFREIYDDRGNVVDDKHCLVVETERLPDMEHDDVIRVVESMEGQQSKEFYEIANRSRFSDGTNMLRKLHASGYLRKYPTDAIELTPTTNVAVKLSEINTIIRKQKSGMSDSDIRNVLRDDTDKPPRTAATSFTPDPTQTIDQAIDVPGEAPLNDLALAKNMLAQAATYALEVDRLKEQAYIMAPSLKPRAGRPPKNANQ
jgi:hypothetical protein